MAPAGPGTRPVSRSRSLSHANSLPCYLIKLSKTTHTRGTYLEEAARTSAPGPKVAGASQAHRSAPACCSVRISTGNSALLTERTQESLAALTSPKVIVTGCPEMVLESLQPRGDSLFTRPEKRDYLHCPPLQPTSPVAYRKAEIVASLYGRSPGPGRSNG